MAFLRPPAALGAFAARVALVIALAAGGIALFAPGRAASPALAQDACTPGGTLAIQIVIDDSGSMAGNDPDLLRAAAARLVIDQLPNLDVVGATRFARSSATTIFSPTTLDNSNRALLKARVDDSLSSSGGTPFNAAFELAGQQIALPSADRKAIIFLSDGQPTDGETTAHRDVGVPVFTVALGEADEALMQRIAAETGGSAFVARDAADVQSAFATIVSALRCEEQSGVFDDFLRPGEVAEHDIPVPPSAAELRATATWAEGNFLVELIEPAGARYGPTGPHPPGIVYTAEPTFITFGATNPTVGTWRIRIEALAGTPPDGVRVTSQITFRDRPPTPAPPVGPPPLAPAPPAAPPPPPQEPEPRATVVLITGLNTENDGVAPGQCGRAGSFRALCERLEAGGHDVYMPSTSRFGDAATIRSRGGVTGNAARFASWLRRTVPGRPLLVGHSMGGLVAREAIVRHGAHAAGLVTIGSPHRGSYVADALAIGDALPCHVFTLAPTLRGKCSLVKAAAAAAIAAGGREAILDLTQASRSLANQTLARGGPRPEATLVGGTAISGLIPVPTLVPGDGLFGFPPRLEIVYNPSLVVADGALTDNYFLPNDGVVGLGSALARGVNGLRGARRVELGRLWHIAGFSPNLYVDEMILDLVAGAAARAEADFVASEVPAVARRSFERGVEGGVARATQRVTRVGPTVIRLSAVRGVARTPGASVPLTNARLTVSDGPFSLRCGARQTPGILIAEGLWVAPTGQIEGCRTAILDAEEPRALLQDVQRSKARAEVVRGSRASVVTFRADRRIAGASVRIGARVLRADRVGRGLVVRVPARLHGREARLSANVAGALHQATLRLPPMRPRRPVTLSIAQLRINQRISQAAVRRVNALQARVEGEPPPQESARPRTARFTLSVGQLRINQRIAQAAVRRVNALSAQVSGEEPPPRERGSRRPHFTLNARQLLINQRISQAAVRRVNDLSSRIEATGEGLRPPRP